MKARQAVLDATGAAVVPDPETRVLMYRTMCRTRRFEERVYRLYQQGGVAATSHLSTGMEAVAAGFGAAMRSDDYMLCTYRGHAHVLAKGTSMAATFGELLGRASGLMHGKGGSMHLASAEHGALGSFAIVGAHIPIAAGAAWSAQLRGTDQVSVCFFGDGATNIGAFHEALNLAAVWRLPAIFVCENNQYMEYTPIGDVIAVEHPAADRAGAYGLDRIVVDGNDADAVFAVAAERIGRARAGDGPALIEAMTYRLCGHSNADPAKYRPDGELDAWLERDPIRTYRARLIEQGIPEDRLDTIDRDASDEVNAASEAAEAAPLANIDAVLTNVWADGGSEWRN